MADDDSIQMMWLSMNGERDKLLEKRTELETELAEVKNQIGHFDGVLKHLAPLADITFDDSDIRDLGLTNAIRFILRTNSCARYSAQDVRNELMEKGYDLGSLSAPMSSIYKILGRLVEESQVGKEKEGYKAYFRWKNDPIDIEDIPF